MTGRIPAGQLRLGRVCFVVCLAACMAGVTTAPAAQPVSPSRALPRSGVKQAGYTTPAQPASTSAKGVPLGSLPAKPKHPAEGSAETLKVVAEVNGDPITREQLAQECLRHYGKDVLDRLINKYLVMEECKRHNVSVGEDEVNAEIERMATKFSLPVQEWLKLLKQERGIGPKQYAADIIWPTLALRKLAGAQLEVTDEDLAKQYEALYGEAVQARLIVVEDARTAEQIRARVVAKPDSFSDLAKEHSKDVGSAAANGMIQPIRRHVGRKEVEDAVFALKPGQISPVVRAGNLYAIFKCEGRLPAAQVNFEKVKQGLITMIQDSKMRRVADDIFRNLREQAKVTLVYGNAELSQQMPGVAAAIGESRITVRELAEVCIERHGEEVLEGSINRRLLEQACKRQGVAVTEKDLDAEIVRAAGLLLPHKADGSADVEEFLRRVTEGQGISMDVYRNDSVWPSVALKKLVGEKVEITSEDMKKGFEANYGERVRCRAIVMSNLRTAQQVWEKARQAPTEENFADLAAKYSVEASSRSLRGEIPPLQKHGGKPLLEKEAFALQAGELSGIIQVGPEQYVVLFCQGRTRPIDVKYDEVKQYLYDDIHEKKMRLAMADHFQELQDSATIDNYLAGTSQSPKRAASQGAPLGEAPSARVPGSRPVAAPR